MVKPGSVIQQTCTADRLLLLAVETGQVRSSRRIGFQPRLPESVVIAQRDQFTRPIHKCPGTPQMIFQIILRSVIRIPTMGISPEPAVAEGGALELYLTPGCLLIYQRTDINQARFIGIQCGEFSSVGTVTVIQDRVVCTRLDLHY